jgi:hypothetical protein
VRIIGNDATTSSAAMVLSRSASVRSSGLLSSQLPCAAVAADGVVRHVGPGLSDLVPNLLAQNLFEALDLATRRAKPRRPKERSRARRPQVRKRCCCLSKGKARSEKGGKVRTSDRTPQGWLTLLVPNEYLSGSEIPTNH